MVTSKPQHKLPALKWVCQNILIIGLLLLKVTTMCAGNSQPGTWLIALRWLSYKVWWSGHQVSGAYSPDKVIHHQSGPSHVSQHFIFIYARMWLIIALVLIKISLCNLPLCVPVYSYTYQLFHISMNPWIQKEGITIFIQYMKMMLSLCMPWMHRGEWT